MKKFIEEFKQFALKGNVMDMAVGVIIGSAFSAIVNSLVSDILSPILGLFGTNNLADMKLVLKQGATPDETVTLNYGAFITAVINFIIMALILFLIVKAINKAKELAEHNKPKPAEEAPKKSDELIVLEEIRDSLKKQNEKSAS